MDETRCHCACSAPSRWVGRHSEIPEELKYFFRIDALWGGRLRNCAMFYKVFNKLHTNKGRRDSLKEIYVCVYIFILTLIYKPRPSTPGVLIKTNNPIRSATKHVFIKVP